eukprot:439946-Rhodomonas_salina.4
MQRPVLIAAYGATRRQRELVEELEVPTYLLIACCAMLGTDLDGSTHHTTSGSLVLTYCAMLLSPYAPLTQSPVWCYQALETSELTLSEAKRSLHSLQVSAYATHCTQIWYPPRPMV